MIKFRWFRKMVNEGDERARLEEFVKVFECERAGLQRLALLLTGNSETVQRCLSCALRDCISSSSVPKDWILRWTRRVIIRNAISLVTNPGRDSLAETSDDTVNGLIAFSYDDSLVATADSDSMFDLPELDRQVYVICFLEHYSMYDCALLLGRSLREVNDARQRVRDYLGQTRELNDIAQRFAWPEHCGGTNDHHCLQSR